MNTSDYLIGHIREALASAPNVGTLDIQVEVSGDTIYLSGTIDCHSKRAAAAEVAERTAPGYAVVNDLKVLTLSPAEPAEVIHDPAGSHR